MNISIVVCTRNRAKYLLQTLTKLKHISAPNILWEIIFVDNGSSDATAEILHEFCANFHVPARVIHAAEPGLSLARNVGWKAAKGNIVCFTDDDCYPDSNWLLMVNQVLGFGATDYVGGRVLLFDKDDAPVTIQTSEVAVVFKKNSHIESGGIIGANLSCTKEMLVATGGFDPRLGAGTRLQSGEDTDLLARASLLGFEGRYDPRIVVYHHHRRKIGTDVKKLYAGYACGRGALSMKTILESNAKILYLKNWYWRMRKLCLERKFDQVFYELKGAIRYISVSAF